VQVTKTLVAAVVGTASSANLVASSAGQSITVWQLIVAGTAADTASIVFTNAGTATTIKVTVPGILAASGVPWAVSDVGTGVTFTAAATTTVTAYYTKGIGG